MNKTAIITGASGNLGKACVHRFLDNGYDIIATVSPGKSLGYDVPDNVVVEQVDLTSESDTLQFIENASKRTIDCALLLVGGFGMGGIDETDNEQLNKMFKLNFFTAYHCARPLFQNMQEQQNGGRIVVVGSKPAQQAKEGKNAVAYALSKSLVLELAKILNATSNSSKVVTHAVVPGIIDTEANRKSMPNADFSDWVTPEAIAENMLWLCSDKARPMRGGVLNLYGNLKA